MHLKHIILLLALGFSQTWLSAQITEDYLWINEFHYDNLTTRGQSDDGEFIELIIHDDILADVEVLSKLELVLYTGGGVGLDHILEIGKGLPYHEASHIYSEEDAVHPLIEQDPLGLIGWQVCDVADKNYAVLSKEIFGLQDLSAGFALIYDKSLVVQLLSYEESFKVADIPAAGAAAGMTSELIATAGGTPLTEDSANTLANPSHSIYLTDGNNETTNKYDDYVWSDPLLNSPSPCEVNIGQTIDDLPCLPPSIKNPGDQTVCGTIYTLPTIEGEFLSGTEAYYDGPQPGGQLITSVASALSGSTIYIYDTNGNCDDEESFIVTFEGAVVIDDIEVSTCDDIFILPEITGIALSGSEAYYTSDSGPGLGVDKYEAGDTYNGIDPLYAYDNNGFCSASKEVTFTTITPPVIEDLANQNACDAFEFPAISGSNLSNAAYYSGENGTGTMFTAGQTTMVEGTYYIYATNGNCVAQQSFGVSITPTPIIDSPMGTLEGCNELILPEIEGSNLSSMRTYYTEADGQGDQIVIGTRLTESVMLHAYDEVNGCKASQPFMVNINAFVPGFAGESQTITEGDDVAPFNVVEAATGNGTFEFQWQSSTDNFTYTDITNATMETYDEGVLNETTYYRRNTSMTTASNVVCEDDGKRLVVNVEEANDALSVELLSFTATAQERKTLLNWVTANEANADGFFVEWSIDGVSFTDLGFVKARNAAGSYEYLHENPASNRNYYRLRQVDLNSKSAHSNIVSVNFAVDFNATLAFFPNPSDGKVGIDLDATYDLTQKIVVEVFDAKGQLVLTSNLLNSNLLDLSSLASGVYQVRLSQNDEQQLGQVIIK